MGHAKKETRNEVKARRLERAAANHQILLTGKCPKCGTKLYRNLSLTGWWQCGHVGAVGFQREPGPHCDFDLFYDVTPDEHREILEQEKRSVQTGCLIQPKECVTCGKATDGRKPDGTPICANCHQSSIRLSSALYSGNLIQMLASDISKKMGIADEPDPCVWETQESSYGACDGGLRCGRPALSGSDYCEKHQDADDDQAACSCGHGRADHASDDIDITGELGRCLVCDCERFDGDSTQAEVLRAGLKRVGCPTLEVQS